LGQISSRRRMEIDRSLFSEEDLDIILLVSKFL
jgi:hypothetical protein